MPQAMPILPALVRKTKLSVVMPCYNEEKTLQACVERVLDIRGEDLDLELIIVDDKSRDGSLAVARMLAADHPEIRIIEHPVNRGKGAALRSGFALGTGEVMAVQDADLEYNPVELRKLVNPILAGYADVVLGSRYLSSGEKRVIYFWHTIGNKLLTFLSNMFTDLYLTDMETCYKVFRREIIQAVDIKENRFGFEPEIVAKIAQMRLRIYEIGVSYHARTYAEGKKIGWKDGFRALYCILKYNAHQAPAPIQFLIYLFIGGAAALVNLFLFLLLMQAGWGIVASSLTSYTVAAGVNYALCIMLLFRHKACWDTPRELLAYFLVVAVTGLADLALTKSFLTLGLLPWLGKSLAILIVLVLNFLGRKHLVFRETSLEPWGTQLGRDKHRSQQS